MKVFIDILEILFLGLLSSLWPLLLVVVVIALNTSRPLRILAGFLAGGLLTTISVDSAIVFVLQGTSLVQGPSASADGWVEIVVGSLALLAALVLARNPARERARAHPRERDRSRSRELIEKLVQRGAALSFVAGIVATILPAPMAIIAMKDLAGLDVTNGQALALIVAFNLLMFLFVELPLLGFLVAPEWTRRATVRFNAWLGRNLRRLAVDALAVGGSLELVRGIVAAVT